MSRGGDVSSDVVKLSVLLAWHLTWHFDDMQVRWCDGIAARGRMSLVNLVRVWYIICAVQQGQTRFISVNRVRVG